MSDRFSNWNPHAQGFAHYDDIETPFEWGKLWMAYGDWLVGPQSGEYADKRGALEAYRAAHDHFERMGAQAKLAEARARIAQHTPVPEPVAEQPPEADAADKPRRPLRRPRAATELDQRSERAFGGALSYYTTKTWVRGTQ